MGDVVVIAQAVITAWLEASCLSQGVPLLVRDPLVLQQVAALLPPVQAALDSRRARREVNHVAA